MSSNFVSQQASFFEFPQPGADFSSVMYMPPSPYVSQPHQMCELVYTPVPTPGGMALTPSFIPVSHAENGQMAAYSGAPSPVPFSQPSYAAHNYPPMAYSPSYYAQGQFNGEFKRPNSAIKNEYINGIPAELWKSMSDQERDDFLRNKRREEAYKTALCTAFLRFNECKYGDECRFAHTPGELRMPKLNHPKYKTVLCRNFAVIGSCPYGSRCQFIHEKYQGSVTEEYVMSVKTEQSAKLPRKQLKTNAARNTEFSFDSREDDTATETVREVKKELHANNEFSRNSDWNETFDKLFGGKKNFARSCMPQLGGLGNGA